MSKYFILRQFLSFLLIGGSIALAFYFLVRRIPAYASLLFLNDE
jgi:hypothetical protein